MRTPQAGWRPKRAGEKKWEAKGVNPTTGLRQSYWGISKEEAESKALESYGFVSDTKIDTLYSFYAQQYLPTILCRSENWKAQVGWAMDKHVLPKFGEHRLEDITRVDAQLWFHGLSKKLKPSSMQKVKIVFSGIMNLAEDDDIIPKNPLRRVKLPRVEEPTKIALTFEELGTLVNATHPLARPFVLLCGCCGLRAGEALGVRRNVISGGVLEVRRQILQLKGGAVDTDTLKTPQSRRTIPLPTGLREAFEVGQVSGIWLCSNSKGGYLLPNNASRELEAAIIASGIRRVTPHELRHTFISLMENELDCPSAIVAELAGKKKKGVNGGYSHAHMTQLRSWMEKFWARVDQVSTSRVDSACLQTAEIAG